MFVFKDDICWRLRWSCPLVWYTCIAYIEILASKAAYIVKYDTTTTRRMASKWRRRLEYHQETNEWSTCLRIQSSFLPCMVDILCLKSMKIYTISHWCSYAIMGSNAVQIYFQNSLWSRGPDSASQRRRLSMIVLGWSYANIRPEDMVSNRRTAMVRFFMPASTWKVWGRLSISVVRFMIYDNLNLLLASWS